jgi:hypothetical protein
MNRDLTHSQLQTVYSHVGDIIDTLDDEAVAELFSGSASDVDSIFETLLNETANIIAFDQGRIKSGSFGYLDKFSTHVDDSLKRYSLNYFITTMLPDFQMNWHHVEWGNLVQMYNRLCVIAARDHGKSYFFSFAYIIWKLYRYQKSTAYKIAPKEYQMSKLGMLITNEFGLAKHLLSLVKDEIENNDLLRDVLYPGKEQKWAETEITTKNGASITIKSFGSKMRGFHPGWVVLDDFMNDSVIYSDEQRKKYISMFHSVVMNMLIPGGQAINVGTPYSSKDLFADLKSNDVWKVFEYPAIFPDGSLLWSDRHNIDSIIEKKNTQGSLIFSREILVRPISNESTIFPWHLLQRAFNEDNILATNIWSHPKKFKRVAVGCDFAISGSVSADYSVFTVLGVDEHEKYWLINQYRNQGMSYNEQIALIKKINTDFRPDVIIMETNGFQSIFAQQGRDANLPVIDHTTTGLNKKDLRTGLPGLSILFEQDRIILPVGNNYSRDVVDTMCIELSSVTFTDKGKLESVSGHDDTAMSLWLARIGCDYINKSFDFTFI